MPVRLDDLRAASQRAPRTVVAKSLTEARALRYKTAFLCHSSADRDLAKGLQTYLVENGWNIYVDWEDTTMPETPSRETADKIRKKIREMDWLLFLATPNSMGSRWCPWEIGYADGAKSPDTVVIIPTTDKGQFYGNEYLQLYRKIDMSRTSSKAELFEAGSTYSSRPLNQL